MLKLLAKVIISLSIGFITVIPTNVLAETNKTEEIKPERQKGIRDYIKVVVKIHTKSYWGSGTICNYDPVKNVAYVLTCAHVFASDNENTCKLEVFYKNNDKLDKTEFFNANVLATSKVHDLSILTFKPNWEVEHYPLIAPSDTEIPLRETLLSVGCDEGSEPALYRHVIFDKQPTFYKCWWNKVRGGRSGGGLYLWDTYYLVGVCHGFNQTEDESYYMNLENIYSFLEENKLNFLTHKFKKPKGKSFKAIDADTGKKTVITVPLPPD